MADPATILVYYGAGMLLLLAVCAITDYILDRKEGTTWEK